MGNKCVHLSRPRLILHGDICNWQANLGHGYKFFTFHVHGTRESLSTRKENWLFHFSRQRFHIVEPYCLIDLSSLCIIYHFYVTFSLSQKPGIIRNTAHFNAHAFLLSLNMSWNNRGLTANRSYAAHLFEINESTRTLPPEGSTDYTTKGIVLLLWWYRCL